MDLIDLYRLADQYGVSIDNFPMRDSVAISFPQGWIAVDFERLQNSMEIKECIAHEMGHIETGSFYNSHSPIVVEYIHNAMIVFCIVFTACRRLRLIDDPACYASVRVQLCDYCIFHFLGLLSCR